MKSKWLKRGVSILLTCIMGISFVACTNTEEDGSVDNEVKNESAKQNVYKYDAFDLQLEGYSDYMLNSIKKIDDSFYALIDGYDYTENSYSSGKILAVISADGSLQSQVELEKFYKSETYGGVVEEAVPVTEDVGSLELEEEMEETDENLQTYQYVSYAEILDDNQLIYLETIDKTDYTDPQNPIWTTEYSVICETFDGTENWRVELLEFSEGEEYFYVSQVLVDQDGNIIIFTGNKIIIFDSNGALVSTVESQLYFNNIYIDADNNICVFYNGVDYTKFYGGIVNKQTGLIEEEKEITNSIIMSANSVHDGTHMGYDLLAITTNGMFGYNYDGDTAVEIMNFINSDISSNNISYVIVESEDCFYGSLSNDYYATSNSNVAYGVFTKVAPEDIPDKEIVTIGCLYTDYEMKYKIIEFNKINEKYRLTILDYSQYNTSTDWDAGTRQFNNDILAGNTPDLMLVNNNLSLANYSNKGVFLDLYEMIDQDDTLERADFLENILQAYEIDGKLYQIMPTFTVETAIAKTQWVGDKEYITIAEINDILATMPEGASAFEIGIDRTSMMNMYLMSNHKYFIDDVTGVCNFDSQEFKDLLEFVNTLPTDQEYEEYWNSFNYSYDYEGQWKADQTLFKLMSVYDLKSFKREAESYIGTDYTIVGLPSIDSNGTIVNTYTSFAISATSSVKEGAWEFIKSYLTLEAQDNYSYQIPILESSFAQVIEKAQEKSYYLDEQGNKVEYDDYYYVNGEAIVSEPFTEEEVLELENFIRSIDKTAIFDNEILVIIEEESAAYFSGQKSVDEVAKIIQSRVQIFTDENR